MILNTSQVFLPPLAFLLLKHICYSLNLNSDNQQLIWSCQLPPACCCFGVLFLSADRRLAYITWSLPQASTGGVTVCSSQKSFPVSSHNCLAWTSLQSNHYVCVLMSGFHSVIFSFPGKHRGRRHTQKHSFKEFPSVPTDLPSHRWTINNDKNNPCLCDVVIPWEERSNSSSYEDVNLIHLNVARAPRDTEACRSPWSTRCGQLTGWRSGVPAALWLTRACQNIYQSMRQTDPCVMVEQALTR